jgi:hypothetical protein
MDQELIQLINLSLALQDREKSFLLSKLQTLPPLEKLKIKQALVNGRVPQIVVDFNSGVDPDNPINKFVDRILPKKPKVPVAYSILSKPNVIGQSTPKSYKPNTQKPFNSLAEIQDLTQLSLITPYMLGFAINSNIDQIMTNFLERVTQLFDQVESIEVRRNLLLNFIKSPLFTSYINTGITALQHPELTPRKISLNLLYQTDQRYLNNRQFYYTAIISNHIRSLAAL